MNRSLSVCIVIYRPDLEELGRTLASFDTALPPVAQIDRFILVDNSPKPQNLRDWLTNISPTLPFKVFSGQGNIGFGGANNLCLSQVGDYHLVLNPDVELAPDSLEKALAFMEAHPECGLLTPLVYGTDGKRQFLCKRYPAVLDLALRGFAPRWLQQLFKKRLDRYQMAEMSEDAVFWDPPIVSGCFMLFRGDVFKGLNGFDPDYFLYFEDFDLSLRTAQISRIAFVPQVRIIHGGGHASRKGAWHVWQFVKSGLTFYRKFGLKLW
ncbi:glycosyltransferase family 2 protein [Rhizobium sp. SL86]|uniref:glycosyltransferase family 2 protein n=1 Tax=Rhizobium sp. SL86 TaxID=2995148 RepID=UPI0022752D01|nr:glycosyltransferase family 2 protein [Rhizobium sp. SL86]MCY1669361.1 glycosyltransferase family 2 protein [Rhizobium sp. SL86]